MTLGYIYVLQNKSYGRYVVKIGLTTRTPDIRAKEIYQGSTGVTEPFDLAVAYSVGDCKIAEKHIHEILKSYRINPRREFFRISPSIAGQFVLATCTSINSHLGIPEPKKFKIEKTKSSDANSDKVTDSIENKNIQEIAINTLKKAPIGTSTLTDNQIERISILELIFEKVLPSLKKEWHQEFSRDKYPEREIVVWENIATAYLQVEEEYLNDEAKNEALNLLLMRSMYNESKVLQKFEFKNLGIDTAKKILSNYKL